MATKLIEKRSVTNLSLKEKIQLRLHKSMCDACSNYEKHSLKIDHLLSSELKNDDSKTPVLTNPELKEKIEKLLP